MKALIISYGPSGGHFLLEHAFVLIAHILWSFLYFQIKGFQVCNGLQESVDFILPILVLIWLDVILVYDHFFSINHSCHLSIQGLLLLYHSMNA